MEAPPPPKVGPKSIKMTIIVHMHTRSLNGNRVHGSFKDHGFHSRKTARKEQAPKCRSKVAPRFGDYKSKKRPPTSKKTPHGSLKRFSKKMIDREVKHFRKQDKNKIARNVQHNAPRNARLNFGAPQASTIFANRFGASFASPAQAADGFIQMGTKLEDVVTGPFAKALEYAQTITSNFEDALHFMAKGEEKRLKVSNKSIEILKFLDRDVFSKYFKGNHHAIEATAELQEKLMEILDYQQDLSKQGHQAILMAYYDAQTTSHKITALKAEINIQTSLTRREMVSTLHLANL